MKGTFITLEGGEGSGKTTVIKIIEKKLTEDGYEVFCSREPGGIAISEEIREIILNKKNTEMDKITEAMLYAASRRQHLIEKLLPALNNGKVVICDRFVDSSLAYQGYARGIGIEKVLELNKLAIDNTMPDLTIFVDCPPKVGLNRISGNDNREVNRLDLESIEFHNKVYEGYQILIKRYPTRIKVVDGTKNIIEVAEATYEIIKEYLNGHQSN